MNAAQRLKLPEIKFPEDIFTFYLSHPHASRHYVREWELGFEGRHPNIALLNPFYDVEGECKEDIRAEDEGREVVREKGANWRLVMRDEIAIAYSRGILGIVDYNSDKSIGTIMEFVYGRMLANNPKLLICTNDRLYNHPWLRTHFHEIYKSFEEFENNVEDRIAHVRKKWGF